MKDILTINCEIPGGFGHKLDFFEKKSLLDGDFVLYSTGLMFSNTLASKLYRGRPLLSGQASRTCTEAIDHWRNEIGAALDVGKTVFVLMAELDQYYLMRRESSSNKVMSGADVSLWTNYSILPFNMRVVHSEGREIALSQGDNILREYWDNFGDASSYQVYIDSTHHRGYDYTPLLTSRDGGRILGAIYRNSSGGVLIALPWIDLARGEFFDECSDDVQDDSAFIWTSEAKDWGSKFLRTLTSIEEKLRQSGEHIQPPNWVSDANFMTLEEMKLRKSLADLEDHIVALQNEKKEANARLNEEASMKALLYAQGRPLEDAILSAMRLLGFEAEHFSNAESEFDGVFKCPEGRMIGEAEGKDSRPIHVDKLRQLSTNIIEDFDRDEVTEQAVGLLFGNAYRLIEPAQRESEQFTPKCKQLAKTLSAVLIRTSDLFEVAKAIADGADENFAKDCRRAIFSTKGGEVQFPAVPKIP